LVIAPSLLPREAGIEQSQGVQEPRRGQMRGFAVDVEAAAAALRVGLDPWRGWILGLGLQRVEQLAKSAAVCALVGETMPR